LALATAAARDNAVSAVVVKERKPTARRSTLARTSHACRHLQVAATAAEDAGLMKVRLSGRANEITKSPCFRPTGVSNRRLNFNLPFENGALEKGVACWQYER
jgi:hypothetical protein